MLNQLIQILEQCKNLSKEWQLVISSFLNNTDSTPAVEKSASDSNKLEKLSSNIKPNRKMAICKLGCALEEWLDFFESFDEDSEHMGLSESEKKKVFWRQLAENSEERIFYKYTLDQNENSDFTCIIKNITNLKIGSDDGEYWEESLDKLPNQKLNESVAAFTARYIRIKKFYVNFVGVEPPLNRYRRKLKKEISDLLIGATGINN